MSEPKETQPWEYDGRIIALTRNVDALFSAVKHFEEKRAEDARRVEELLSTVIQLTQTNRLLVAEVNDLKARVR